MLHSVSRQGCKSMFNFGGVFWYFRHFLAIFELWGVYIVLSQKVEIDVFKMESFVCNSLVINIQSVIVIFNSYTIIKNLFKNKIINYQKPFEN